MPVLPVVTSPVEALQGAPSLGAAVLLVDDAPENLVALSAVLAPLAAQHRLRVLTAASADEALRHALAEGERLAVVILDVIMPGVDGPELARLIRARRHTAHVPVLFVTALDAERRRLTEAYQSGAVDYLTKPLDADMIRAKVGAFVELHRRRVDASARERRRFADEARATSEQARAESAALRARLALVLDSLPDAVSVFDRDWRYLYVNPAAATLLRAGGLDPATVLGRALWDVVPSLRGTRGETEFRRAGAEGRVTTVEEHYARIGQWIESRLVPGPDGTLTVFARDVTAQRQAEATLRDSEARMTGLLAEAAAARADAEAARAEAERANTAKSHFLASMSHELRTPLNAIMGHVALVETEVHGPVSAAQRGALARVRRAQEHLMALINDVLDFARIEAGHVNYALASVHLADVLREAVAMLEPQAAAARLTIEVAPLDEGLLVWADREKLRQVVLNLLGNAVKFTPAGGRVVVDVETAPDVPEVRLHVRDTGVGIAASDLERVFEPFVRVGDGRTPHGRPTEGTGLGLAISRDLARGMGGDLTAASVVGGGSTFTVTLRRAGAPRRALEDGREHG